MAIGALRCLGGMEPAFDPARGAGEDDLGMKTSRKKSLRCRNLRLVLHIGSALRLTYQAGDVPLFRTIPTILERL